MQSRPLVLLAALAVLFAGGATAAVSVLAAGKEAVSTTTVGAELKDPDLAARFAPVLMLMNGELFHPIDRPTYVAYTDLVEVIERRGGHRDYRLIDPSPTLQTLGTVKDCVNNCHWALKVAGLDMHYGLGGYAALERRLMKDHKPTVYWHIVQGSTGTIVQYWFFYLFDNWKNWHESDLEQISIRLDASGKTPCEAGYSQHATGEVRTWGDVEKSADGHAIVYVAVGSHANYFEPKKRQVKVRVFGAHFFSGFDHPEHPDPAQQLAPADYQLVRLGPPIFRDGDYGSGNFGTNGRERPRLFGNRVTVADPRTRGAIWSNPSEWLAKFRPSQPTSPEPGC